MTNQAIISKLSELPIAELDNLRIMLSLALQPNYYPSKDFINACERWAGRASGALELKQAERLRGYEAQDVDYSFV